MTSVLDERSRALRTTIVDALVGGGRGHVGAALSLVEILRVLYDEVLHVRPAEPRWPDRDRLILSKGHGCLALYAVLADHGFFPASELLVQCKPDAMLGGHPETHIPGVEASTGALGHGLPIGVGMALAARLAGSARRVFVVMGDGEINEGSVWEAALMAAKHGLTNLTAILDYNKLQSYGPVDTVLPLEPLVDKWRAFGFGVRECDGHDVAALAAAFAALPYADGRPNLLVAHTVKGRGIGIAEHDPKWHHKASFDPAQAAALYDAIGRTNVRNTAMHAIYELAKRDPRVVFIGSDLGAGVLDEMRRELPERFFMEGVSEQAIVGMAAGLAMDGYLPYVNTIATFLTRRCFEQVAIDLCLHNLPVRLIASGGGTVYAPLGPTHMATEDLAILRTLPNMAIVAPIDAPEMARTMDASLAWPGPLYVRIAKGGDPLVSDAAAPFAIGRAIAMRAGDDVVFIGTGPMSTNALAASDLLRDEAIAAGVLHVHTVKPLETEAILAAAARARLLVTVEEHTIVGGLGSAVAETLADAGIAVPLLRLALPDRFSRDYGSQAHVLARAGLAPAAIASATLARLRASNPSFAATR